jgi:cysteinyl-tRNA synthetase
MRLYNTLTKQVETVQYRTNSSCLGVYACGPTVYDFAHIGHMRKYTMDDVLLRTLRAEGFEAKHVMNITDVGHLVSDGDTGEDKMEKGARKAGKSVWEVAKYFEDDFWAKTRRMGLIKPDVAPRATDHIAEQIVQIQELEKNGFTYEIPGDGIYFDTAKDLQYGELARLKKEELLEGARIGVVEGKHQLSDFALWKFSPQNEKRQMEWESPWGVGFPGWHIECSAMGMKYLGEQFDLHTGGIDHIPVHHTNEIAQAENSSGKRPFVKIWVHHNFLRVDGKKMSKSLENFYTLDDIEERGFSPMALKLLFLQSYYRDELNFTWESLSGAQKGYEKLSRRVEALRQLDEQKESPEGKLLLEQFKKVMADDLKTSQAIAILWKAVKSQGQGLLPAIEAMLEQLGLIV